MSKPETGTTMEEPLTYIYNYLKLYIQKEEELMSGTITSIRLDLKLADEAVKVLGAKSRTEAIHIALREIVALKDFKALMSKYRGKLEFAGLDE
jgi:Arc/MetJ family transcription regulator